MSEDKPLHVRVAEALGTVLGECENLVDCDGASVCHRCGWEDPTWNRSHDSVPCIPRYDTDWSMTGPLIEKYGITLACVKKLMADDPSEHWIAAPSFRWLVDGRAELGMPGSGGSMPMIAVCNLILALKEAGKL